VGLAIKLIFQTEIQEGHMKLLDLVVSVGPYVTAEDLTEQAKGI
jgi:hypothetical protein